MEQNLPIIAKKVWSLVRVIFFMLRKSISKTKLFSDLNMIIQRGKIAGKAFHNLLFHYHHNWVTSTFHNLSFPNPPPCPTEYEFSCKDTPPNYHPLSLFSNHKKHKNKHRDLPTPHAPPPPPLDHANDDIVINAAVMKALEMLTSATASPGFGKSPMVKQLRITDSPFPLSNGDEDGHVVDEAAEKFIIRFYNDLRRQN